MSKTQSYISNENEHLAQNYHPLPVVLAKAEGVWVEDIENHRYMDMMSAYSAVSVGHANPRILSVMEEQAKTLCVTSRAFHHKWLAPFMDFLCEISGLDKVLPMNTGAEAVETAIKAARRWGYQKKGIPENQAQIIVAKDNFHGRTVTITSFSSEEESKSCFGPFTPGFVEIPYADSEALRAHITPDTCAFLVEPIQGEAGVHIPPKGWLKECEQICRENNVLMILDEIQSGLCRTGKMFAFEHENVSPDGLILGKALGGGIYPVSAFVATKEVMDVFSPGSHGSTFGGNALATRIGLESLKILVEDNLAGRSATLGQRLLQELKKIDSPLIKDVRGRGLWIGLEVFGDKISGREVCMKLLENGILTKEAHDTVIRIAPPLTISEEELDWGVAQIRKTFSELNK